MVSPCPDFNCPDTSLFWPWIQSPIPTCQHLYTFPSPNPSHRSPRASHSLPLNRKKESEVIQSCPTLCGSQAVAYQAPPSMGFSRQEYWSGLPFDPSKWELFSFYKLLHHFPYANVIFSNTSTPSQEKFSRRVWVVLTLIMVDIITKSHYLRMKKNTSGLCC